MVVTDAVTRRNKILEIVVDSYVSTAIPVGSFAVSKRFRSALSPATIRNIMSELEQLGYITHPHTSAGRVPTDKGYRYYVDMIMEASCLTEDEKESIARALGQELDEFEDLIRKATRLISEMTSQASLISFPRAKKRTFKRIELIRASPSSVYAILFTAQGVVKHCVFEFEARGRERELSQISQFLNEELRGLQLDEIKDRLLRKLLSETDPYHHLFKEAYEIFNRSRLLDEKDEKLLSEGAHHMLEQPEFRSAEKVKAVLKALEDEDGILSIMDGDLDEEGVRVHIGSENPCEGMRECSVVISNYKIGAENIGGIGVIGPTRLDYSRVVAVVEHMSGAISRFLARLSG